MKIKIEWADADYLNTVTEKLENMVNSGKSIHVIKDTFKENGFEYVTLKAQAPDCFISMTRNSSVRTLDISHTNEKSEEIHKIMRPDTQNPDIIKKFADAFWHAGFPANPTDSSVDKSLLKIIDLYSQEALDLIRSILFGK